MNKSLIALIGSVVRFTEAYTGGSHRDMHGEFSELSPGVYRITGKHHCQTFMTTQVAEIRIRANSNPQLYVVKL